MTSQDTPLKEEEANEHPAARHPPSYYPPSHHLPPPPGVFYPPPVVPAQNTTSPFHTSLLLATGGFLGMTAAAAIRWLNGEDFSLLPPKQDPPPSVDVEELRQQQVDKIVQRLTNVLEKQHEKQRTNDCVNLLRTKSSSSEDVVVPRLMQIQSELTALRQTLQENEPWEQQLSDTLNNLHDCVEHLRGNTVDDGSNHRTNAMTRVELPKSSLNHPNENNKDPSPTSLTESVRTLMEQNHPEDLRAGVPLLFLYISNLLHHPTAPRYQKIFMSNDSFQKVDQLVGGKEFLLVLGFVEQGTYLEWQQDVKDHGEVLQCATSALKVLKAVPSVMEPEFVERVVAAARGTSCPPTPTIHTSHLEEIKTPEIGLIASPPNTRKQHFENPAFPLLDGNDVADNDESPVLPMSAQSNRERTTEESFSPIRDSTGDTEATDVLWK
jgi:hypothetical protein